MRAMFFEMLKPFETRAAIFAGPVIPGVALASDSDTPFISGVTVLDFIFHLDAIPRVFEKYRTKNAFKSGGGNAANASVAISKLGSIFEIPKDFLRGSEAFQLLRGGFFKIIDTPL